MIKLCIANFKGGVSKTTTAVNLSSILVEKGYKTLLIDLDPQGNASENLGIDIDSSEQLDNTMYDVFAKDVSIRNAIYKTKFGVDLIPSNKNLADAEMEVAGRINREKLLDNAIEDGNLDYDFIIIDTPPHLGILSINGLVATDKIIVSVDVGYFSLSGIGELLETINLIRKSQLNKDLDILGVLMTKVDNRTTMSKTMRDVLKEGVGDKVFETQIAQNIAITNSQASGMPINFYNKKCTGYIEYEKFAEEVLSHVKG